MINNFVSMAQTGTGYVILTFKTVCYKYETILLLIITAPFYPQSISFSCVCVVMVSPMLWCYVMSPMSPHGWQYHKSLTLFGPHEVNSL